MKHWTEDDITQWLYGIREDRTHLQECEVCRSKAAQAKNRRLEFLNTSTDVAPALLAAQRRVVYQRLEQRPHTFGYRLAASLALVLLVAVISFNLLHRSGYAPLASPADERLYSDMVAIDERSEPRAIQPIESLFEE